MSHTSENGGRYYRLGLDIPEWAETCAVAEEAVVAAHLVLSAANFDGDSASPLEAEDGGAALALIDLVAVYNAGELCV